VAYIFDVAHNPQAAEALVQTLKQHPVTGKTHALVGMLKDKDCRGFFHTLAPVVDHWFLLGLPGSRGATGQYLAYELQETGNGKPVTVDECMGEALTMVQSQICSGDRVLITGSFLTVAAAMEQLGVHV
jgi:dihydrofolate synthase/folylpolyglutamate synthase